MIKFDKIILYRIIKKQNFFIVILILIIFRPLTFYKKFFASATKICK